MTALNTAAIASRVPSALLANSKFSMPGLFPVVADVVSQLYRDLRRAPIHASHRLITPDARMQARKGCVESADKCFVFDHAAMVVFLSKKSFANAYEKQFRFRKPS